MMNKNRSLFDRFLRFLSVCLANILMLLPVMLFYYSRLYPLLIGYLTTFFLVYEHTLYEERIELIARMEELS